MTGTKATALEKWCDDNDREFTRFDYSGHGQSSGVFTEGTIGQWKQDCLNVIDRITTGPQVLVGSSMGGWIALLCAIDRPARVAGLVGIACAADFSEQGIWNALSASEQGRLKTDGVIARVSDYQDEPYLISYKLIEEARHHLLLGNEIGIDCPVRLIHGQNDRDVPWGISMEVAKQLRATDVQVHLIKDGDHRLSTDRHLAEIMGQLRALLESL